MNGTILLVSDTPICGPFGPEAGPEKALSSSREDAIRARLADTAAQGARRRRLEEILKRPTPAWNPDDHPENRRRGRGRRVGNENARGGGVGLQTAYGRGRDG